MKKLMLLLVLFASIFANGQVIGVYCDKTIVAPNEEVELRFVVSGGSIQYFSYTDGTDHCLISNISGNAYIEKVSPSVDTKYTLTYVEPGSIDSLHMEILIQVVGDPVSVQTVFNLPESCFDNDNPINLRPLFWSNVPYYEDLVKFEGPGVYGDYFYPNLSGGPGLKPIMAHLEYHGADHGITREIRVIRYGTGVDEQSNIAPISMFPNPTSGLLNFSESCKVEVYSMTGELVKRFDDVITCIDLSDLSSGVYTVRMFTGGQTISKKVIKH